MQKVGKQEFFTLFNTTDTSQKINEEFHKVENKYPDFLGLKWGQTVEPAFFY